MLIDAIICTLTDVLTDTLTDALTGTLTGTLTGILTDTLTDTLTGILTDTLTDILTDILTDVLTNTLTDEPPQKYLYILTPDLNVYYNSSLQLAQGGGLEKLLLGEQCNQEKVDINLISFLAFASTIPQPLLCFILVSA